MKKLFPISMMFILILTFILSGCGGSSSTPTITTLINYPMVTGYSGDLLDRAFYITAYPGTTLSKVTLYFSATTPDTYTVQLQAIDGGFNGNLIGTATSSFSSSTGSDDFKAATFDFHNVAVTKGHVVAFKFGTVSGGSGYVYFYVTADTGGNTSIVYETADTTSLSKMRDSIAIKVEGQN